VNFWATGDLLGTLLAPSFAANSVGGTLPVFGMGLNLTVILSPQLDLASDSGQTQDQIMYPIIVLAGRDCNYGELRYFIKGFLPLFTCWTFRR